MYFLILIFNKIHKKTEIFLKNDQFLKKYLALSFIIHYIVDKRYILREWLENIIN